jgi:hypothetical protein
VIFSAGDMVIIRGAEQLQTGQEVEMQGEL